MRLLIFLVCSFVGALPTLAADITQVTPKDLANQGIAAYKRGDYANALRFLHARASLVPQDATVFYYLGNCYMHSKQNENAARMYSACIRSGPGTEASKLALSALETLSTMPKSAPSVETKPEAPDPKAAEASRDALSSTNAVDKAFNDAVVRIRNQRQTFKIKVDGHWHRLEDDLQSMNPKSTPNYSVELERIRRETDNKVEFEQLKQLRWENRMLGPDKVDVRAVPEVPKEKIDDTKNALGSLGELFQPEKPYDPFGPEVNAQIAAKFLTAKDVFGELSTYQPSERRVAKQVFLQLKNSIELKQDSLDQQIHQVKDNLIRDMVHIKINYNVSGNPAYVNKESTTAYHMSNSKIPRSDQNNLSPADLEISQTTERAKKRLNDLKESYLRDVDSLIAGAKERVGGMVISTGQMNSQLKKPSGTIQLVPLGSDSYTRNYVNFGSRDQSASAKGPSLKPLRAEPMKTIQPNSSPQAKAQAASQTKVQPPAETDEDEPDDPPETKPSSEQKPDTKVDISYPAKTDLKSDSGQDSQSHGAPRDKKDSAGPTAASQEPGGAKPSGGQKLTTPVGDK